mmetsp:Transcript_26102/g.57026  ORF Transcript_26102/g.57026 Transcript_26102/m.57026 type:complete len:381 (-) Transcript_26102:1015-2157(-)
MVRKIVVAVDESVHSRAAVDWLLQSVTRRATDEFHLVAVLPPLASAVIPAAPVATAAALSASQHQLEAQKAHAQQEAAETLKATMELLVVDYKVSRENIHLHTLPPAGGASGVADSIAQFVKSCEADLAVLGTRGMGAIKRSLMSFIGLGSVSDYCLHHITTPVLVVRTTKGREPQHNAEANPGGPAPLPKKVLVAHDESPQASKALLWALDNVLNPHDQLHLVTVALSIPYPLLDESAAVAAAAVQQYTHESQQSLEHAEAVCQKAAGAAMQHGVLKTKITTSVLTPEDGSSDVGKAICSYAEQHKLDLVVAGSRGMGSMQRSLMGLIGLGSVTDYLAHNSPCPLVVVKADPPTHLHNESSLLPRLDEEGTAEGTPKED